MREPLPSTSYTTSYFHQTQAIYCISSGGGKWNPIVTHIPIPIHVFGMAKSSNDCYTLIYINLVKSSLKSKLFHCDTKPMWFYTCALIFTGSSNFMYWHERKLFVADPKETHSVPWRFSLTGHRDCPVP